MADPAGCEHWWPATSKARCCSNSIVLLHQYVIFSQPALLVSARCCSMDKLFTSQTEAQRLLAKHVSAYPLWTSGEMSGAKWPAVVQKFNSLYETDISPAARQWRKKRGQCCAHLIAAALPDQRVRWALIVTEAGGGPVKAREKLSDARRDRIVWGDYILIHATRPREAGGGSRWTWFLLPKIEKQEADYVTGLAQSAGRERRPDRLANYLEQSLLRRPMHSGVRQQIAKMLRRAQKVWAKHAGGMQWPGPDPAALPAFGRYRQTSGD